jgi:hypothetical protein
MALVPIMLEVFNSLLRMAYISAYHFISGSEVQQQSVLVSAHPGGRILGLETWVALGTNECCILPQCIPQEAHSTSER